MTLSADYMAEHLAGYQKALAARAAEPRWRTYPFMVSIETYAKCNAACDFCPYPQLERQGDVMPAETFEKILADLAETDERGPAMFSLCRVNEPFLDKRFFHLAERVETTFPTAHIQHNSNATPLNAANFDRLLKLKRTAFLKLSFNDHRPDEYERVMQIPFARSYANVKMIHERKAAKEFWWPVVLGRVGDGTSADDDFLAWARDEFPLFKAHVSPRFDWLGKIKTDFAAPDVGCSQWFQLHILANGRDAYCCTDSDAKGAIGNAATHHAVHDLYNAPERLALRDALPSRRNVAGCAGCAALA